MSRSQPEEQPWTDEIVAEVRSAREELFAASGYDLKKFAELIGLINTVTTPGAKSDAGPPPDAAAAVPEASATTD